MKRILLSSFLLLFLLHGTVFSQRDSLRNIFLDAESWFLFEEYADALPLFEGLLKNDPGNDNLKYKIGICLLNDPYQKHLSIQYLVEASNNINPDYKENSYKEITAPPDVLFYLGNAYLVNELMDRAIESYEEFLKIMDRDVYDEELVNAQIRACNNAKRLKTMPVDIDLLLLDSLINTRYADIHPVISGDGTKLAFVTELPFYDGAFFCEKTDAGWSYPQSITQSLGFDADIYPVGLSHDGTEMILYYDDEYIGNLYYSKYEEGRWLPATKLGDNISTKYWESYACFDTEGNTLYFTSNRKGTHGGLDIYKSDRLPDGSWGVAENLGTNINSRYNEETPVISEDGQTLYFSSYGHYNIGGYDIFYSKKNADGTWGEPINLGYPINTTDDDLYFQPVNNGTNAYYSLYSPSGKGNHDIYYMEIYSVDNPRMYFVTGKLNAEDSPSVNSQMAIFIVDSQTGDTVMISSPDSETGEFSFNLKKGIYELHFKGEGYVDLIKPLHIDRYSDKSGITLEDNIQLALVKNEPDIFEGEKSQIQLEDTLYAAKAGESITVPLRLRRGSILITKVYQDSVLMSIDTLEVERRRTDLEIIPLPGISKIELEMIDRDGNIHINAFEVVGEEPIQYIEEDEPLGGPDQEQFEPGHSILEEPVGDMLNELEGDASQLHSQMLENSDGSLKEYLAKLDLVGEGILTPEDLIMHLEEVAAENGFSAENLKESLVESLNQIKMQEADSDPDRIAALKSLLSMQAEGTLKELLEDLNPEQEEIKSQIELFEHLYEQAESNGYTIQEVDELLIQAVAEDNGEVLLESLKEHAEGHLKDYLDKLDLEAAGINSTGELMAHLEKVGIENGFTMDDVRGALLTSLEQIQLSEDDLFEQMY
ncbi:MAG: hypothetical protein DRI70_07825, partial [Bacteroidetes bacterium]